MLDPRQYHTTSPVDSAEPFQAYLQQPFPRTDRKSTRLNSSHLKLTRMPSSA